MEAERKTSILEKLKKRIFFVNNIVNNLITVHQPPKQQRHNEKRGPGLTGEKRQKKKTIRDTK